MQFPPQSLLTYGGRRERLVNRSFFNAVLIRGKKFFGSGAPKKRTQGKSPCPEKTLFFNVFIFF